MKAALLQITSSDDPSVNLDLLRTRISDAVAAGAGFVLTPEVSNMVSLSRTHQVAHLQTDEADPTLAGLRECAAKHGIWLSVGSLALKTDDPDGRFANRSFMIDPNGEIKARYDKIHMFDVQVSESETYRESAGFRPGDQAVCVDTPFGRVGLTICYDVRFPHLYRHLAQHGAEIILAPAAFSPLTGEAHWEPLLRARAIETTSYVLAAAQTGQHPASRGKSRQTYGHSLAVSPWGEVLGRADEKETIVYVDLDRTKVAQARSKLPSLTHDRSYKGCDE